MKIYSMLIGWILLIAITKLSMVEVESSIKAVKTHTVEIKQMQFVPSQITIAAGDSIRWVNRDIVAHNISEEDSAGWASQDLKTGESFVVQVNHAASYLCTLHPVMKGEILLDLD